MLKKLWKSPWLLVGLVGAGWWWFGKKSIKNEYLGSDGIIYGIGRTDGDLSWICTVAPPAAVEARATEGACTWANTVILRGHVDPTPVPDPRDPSGRTLLAGSISVVKQGSGGWAANRWQDWLGIHVAA